MIEVPRPPVILRVALGALLLKLLLVRVLVAVLAYLRLLLVLVLLLVALGAPGGLVRTYKRELRLRVVVKSGLLPVEGGMAVLADIPKLLLVDIILHMAGYARLFYRLVLALNMALGAVCLLVLSFEPVCAVLRGVMVEYQLLPVIGRVARLADLVLELALVDVLVAVVALLVGERLVLAVYMALGALHLRVLAVELVAGVRWGGVVEGVLLPAVGSVARLALLILELSFMLVLMAVVALLELYRLVPALYMTLGALYILVLEGKRVLRVPVMRELFFGIFPVLYVVAGLALLRELSLVLVLVAGGALLLLAGILAGLLVAVLALRLFMLVP